MGARGPAPKRDAERRRRNQREVATTTLRPDQIAGAEVEIPAADESWHPVAIQWYESLQKSLVATFYEPSDWALAYTLGEQLSRELKPQVVGVNDEGEPVFAKVPMKGASLSAILKGFSQLMVSEADRRRLSIEVERSRAEADTEDAGVTNISSRRAGRVS